MAKKKRSEWQMVVKEIQRKNPGLSLKAQLKLASKEYKKLLKQKKKCKEER